MAILNVNLTKRSESKGTMVPDGKYTVEVAKAFLGKSKVKRVDQIEVHLEVVSPEEWVGSTIMEFLPLSEASEWKRADFFHACGFDSDENELRLSSGLRFGCMLSLIRKPLLRGFGESMKIVYYESSRRRIRSDFLDSVNIGR